MGRGLRGSALAGRIALAAAAIWPVPASSAEPPALPWLALTWEAPRGCPGAADVEEAIARIVGRTSAEARREPIRVRGLVREDDGRFRAELEVERGDSRGRRTVAAPDCALATDAAVVVLATAVGDHSREPVSSTSPVPVSTVSDAAPVADVDAAPVADVDAAPVARRVSKPEPVAGASFFVDSATLPAAAAGAAVTMAWAWTRARLSGGLGGTLPVRGLGRTTLDGRTLGVDASLLFASLRGGIQSRGGRVVVLAQAGADVGIVHGKGVGAWVPFTRAFGWVALAAGPAVRFEVAEPLVLGGALEAIVPLVRPGLRIDNESIHRPAALSARAGVFAELRL